ncbi:hypothetical protein GO755_30375 [Spirosoma sp. HMF4905]|uniref:Uncharacterized protein n=1 Tax=Spirosoma arboris TaxID=2682092 RepID=A0A7K1SKP3_9BACT|nr:hypothetical protein [Spirosoma arboris]MVM34377.1 hypothetical protein [Spirosoma arboris]
MSIVLPTANFRIGTAPYPAAGWTFAVLGPIPDGETEALQRQQIGNPVFVADYDNNPFMSDVVYKFLASHPDYQSDAVLVRGYFDENEGFHALSDEEADSGSDGSLSRIIDAASSTELRTALVSLFEAAMANSVTKRIICEYISTCDTTTPPTQTYIFTNPIDYEAVATVAVDSIDVEILDEDWEGTSGDSIDVEILDSEWEGEVANPVPTVNNHQPDQLITASGDQYYDLNADLFADPDDTQSLLVRRQDKATSVVSALPVGISFGFDATTGLRRITVLSTVVDQILRMFVTDTDSVEQTIWDIHQLTINRAQIRIMPDVSDQTHSNDFSVNFFDEDSNPSPGYAFIGGTGTWGWSAGQLCQTATASSSDMRMVQFTSNGSQNSLDADRALGLIKPTAFTSDSRLGIGLRFGSGASDGYALVITDNTSVQLLHSGVSFGPSKAFVSALNVWYFVRMLYEETGSSTARISAKIWNALQAEPESWPIVWEDQPRQSGYPVMIAGYNGAKGCIGPWYDSKTLAP